MTSTRFALAAAFSSLATLTWTAAAPAILSLNPADSARSIETATMQPSPSVSLAGFESSLSSWVPNAVGATGRYNHLTLLQPADDPTTNFASTGTGAASLGKGGDLVSPALDLSGGGIGENLTLSLSFVLHNGSSTRRSYIDYSRDGGSNWFTIAMMQLGAAGASSNKTVYSGTVKITEGSSTVNRTGNLDAVDLTGHTAWTGAAFTSNSKLRIRNLGSGSADIRLFVDNLAVTSSIAAGSGNPFAAWSGGAAFDADANSDGVDNGIAWLLGAAGKEVNALAKLPLASQTGGSLTLTFTCLNAASRGNAAIQIQHSGTMGQGDPWVSVLVPETSGTVDGVNFTVTPNGSSNQVVATIAIGEAQAGKLFARLRAVAINP